MAFRLSSLPVLAERFTRVMCPPGPRMLGWVAKTLARRQHDEHLKSIHRVWHYIPEAPEYVSFHTLKFLTRLADVNFDRVIEHLSTSDIVIVDGTRISRNPAWRLTPREWCRTPGQNAAHSPARGRQAQSQDRRRQGARDQPLTHELDRGLIHAGLSEFSLPFTFPPRSSDAPSTRPLSPRQEGIKGRVHVSGGVPVSAISPMAWLSPSTRCERRIGRRSV